MNPRDENSHDRPLVPGPLDVVLDAGAVAEAAALDEATAERLLSGDLDGVTGHDILTAVLALTTAPPRPSELNGEHAAVNAFHTARAIATVQPGGPPDEPADFGMPAPGVSDPTDVNTGEPTDLAVGGSTDLMATAPTVVLPIVPAAEPEPPTEPVLAGVGVGAGAAAGNAVPRPRRPGGSRMLGVKIFAVVALVLLAGGGLTLAASSWLVPGQHPALGPASGSTSGDDQGAPGNGTSSSNGGGKHHGKSSKHGKSGDHPAPPPTGPNGGTGSTQTGQPPAGGAPVGGQPTTQPTTPGSTGSPRPTGWPTGWPTSWPPTPTPTRPGKPSHSPPPHH